jgi:hypothetical protein
MLATAPSFCGEHRIVWNRGQPFGCSAVQRRARGNPKRPEDRFAALLIDDEPPELAFYCSVCAEREFGSE